jgi:two-component system catabolic regulation response regulator CreB/two-component system response regulator ChvI
MDDRINGKQIMVVDDESDLTLYYRTSLEYYGFIVDTFNEPTKALSNFKSDYYDLVILDIKMPDMNGFELYTKLKEKDPKVKACFLTASELYYEEFRDKEYDSLDKELFIRKPIENDELIEKIKRLIPKQCNK